MKFCRFYVFMMFLFISSSIAYSQIGINTITPDTSAALHIVSKPYGQGLLIPRLFQARKTTITTPARGLLAYDLSSDLFYFNRTAGTNDWFAVNPWLTKGDSVTQNVMYTHTVVTNVGIGTTTPSARLDVNGSITSNSVVTTNTLTVPGFPNNALLPAGAIIMWSNYGGVTLPLGWALCDGSNGTPDLRGRFIVSAGTNLAPAVGDSNPVYTVGQNGGENTHTLTVNQLPKHNHKVNGDGATVGASGGAHSHNVYASGQGTGYCASGCGKSGYANDSGGTLTTDAPGHTHPNSDFSGQTGDGTSQGMNSQPFENRPPFYVLAFIMKLP